MRLRLRAFVLALAMGLPMALGAPAAETRADNSLQQTIRAAQQKVVKIYGAGGLRGLEAYQSGVLISGDGQVLTALSYVLDADDLAIILDDGRKFSADMLGVEPIRELAVLKLKTDDADLPHFKLNDAAAVAVGDRVLAMSNLFNIAAGDEPVSALQGIVTAIVPLDARRGAFRSNYSGPVIIVDAAANNPGAAGGALIDWHGQLVGVLAKELKSSTTGAWLNYALPIHEIAPTVAKLSRGESIDESELPTTAPTEPLSLGKLGIVLVPDVLERTPPYIDAVYPKSPAERAGLRADDLLVFLGDQPTVSCTSAAEAIGRHESYEEVHVSVLRDGKLIDATLTPDPDSGDKTDADKDSL